MNMLRNRLPFRRRTRIGSVGRVIGSGSQSFRGQVADLSLPPKSLFRGRLLLSSIEKLTEGIRRAATIMELARNLRVESVRRLNPSPAQYLDITATVADAVATLRRERVGCLLICDQGRLVGIFTDRDVLIRVFGGRLPLTTPICCTMTPEPVTVQADEPIFAALRKMQAGSYRHLPIVDGSNRPIGVISVKEVVHYLVEHFPAAVYNVPPDPDTVPRQREGA